MISQLNNLKRFFEKTNDIRSLEKISRLISIANQETPISTIPGPIRMDDPDYTYKYIPQGQGVSEMGGGNYFEVVTDKKEDQYQRVGFMMGPMGTYDPGTREKTSNTVGWQRLIRDGQGQGMDQARAANQYDIRGKEEPQKVKPGKTASKQEVMSIIIEEFTSAGYPIGLAHAAIVNAKAESNLDPNAVGDGGKSVGLFQLYERGGGRGMSVEQRKDPRLNTKRIIQELRAAINNRGNFNGTEIPSIQDALNRGAKTSELAGLFCYHVERPRDRIGHMIKRQNLAKKLFGNDA